VPDSAAARHLAEFGVVFLMFSIGLEFSLPRLYSMKRTVFGLGLAQVGLTLLINVPVAVLAGLTFSAGIALGGILAMSSTALVVKMLAERMQLESKHGREIIGVLLFQDLAVVPLLILVPALSQSPGGDGRDTGRGGAEGRRGAVADPLLRPAPDARLVPHRRAGAARPSCSCSMSC
jgi:CPA2 family monovalent cation:H+ antiporter-2